MKKIILAFVFIFATGAFVNASSNQLPEKSEIILPISCFNLANNAAAACGVLGSLSYEEEHALFLTLYSACLKVE